MTNEELQKIYVKADMKLDALKDNIHHLAEENKQLKEDLQASQTNEETYRLEMQEITKILGLDEDTLFDDVKKYTKQLRQENKQLKEELENDIDRYEDTISYQLGFDKGKEYLQQIIDNAKEYIKNILKWVRLQKDFETEKILLNLLILLGDKE